MRFRFLNDFYRSHHSKFLVLKAIQFSNAFLSRKIILCILYLFYVGTINFYIRVLKYYLAQYSYTCHFLKLSSQNDPQKTTIQRNAHSLKRVQTGTFFCLQKIYSIVEAVVVAVVASSNFTSFFPKCMQNYASMTYFL